MSGRETPGHIMSDKSGNLYSAITGEPIAAPAQTRPAPAGARPAEQVDGHQLEQRTAIVEQSPSTQTDADALADLDEEQIATARAMLTGGHLSAEEVKRLHNLTDTELAALQAPQVPKQSITRELEKIAALRKTDRRAYDKDYAMQARELALLEQQAQAKEAGASSEPGDASAMPQEVLASWKESGAGVEHCLRVAQETASAAFNGLAEDERTQLVESFETALPPSVQVSIYTHLGSQPGFTRPATPETVEAFSKLGEAHAELAASWGSDGPKNLGRAQARISSILQGMTPSDRQAASDWFDGLPEAQAASIIRGLSGKGR